MEVIRRIYGYLEEIGDIKFLILPVIAVFAFFTEYTEWISWPVKTLLIVVVVAVAIGIAVFRNVRRQRNRLNDDTIRQE